jgi:L-amino acid N-acyltransferase YncA
LVSEKIALGDVGKGRARALVHMSLPSVRDAGYDRIVAFVTEGNKPSEKLLVNLGFRMVQ